MMYQSFPTVSLASEVCDELGKSLLKQKIHQPEINAKEENRDNHNDRRTDDLLSTRPGNFLHLAANIEIELLCFSCPVFNFFCRIHELDWQARRDSNPQHPVLETGALPVGATGLH